MAAETFVSAQTLPYDEMAARIAGALKIAAGERVLIRFNPAVMRELEPAAKAALERAGARVETLGAGPVADLEARLAQTDIYIWLPGASAVTTADDRAALTKWVDGLGAGASAKAAGSRRELHFHWVEGTLQADGLPAKHAALYDRLYLDALAIDYEALNKRMERAVALLRSGEVRVTDSRGTDIRFRVGERPFNLQNGDASRDRASKGRMRIDRHIELPAGVMRVAPTESSVRGTLAIASFPIGAARATDVRLEFEQGRIVKATAGQGLDALNTLLATPGASEFREFCLGFNPRLAPPSGEATVPYYGYGDGVVRMSLGNNEELGGSVRGDFVRWIFFTDATVTVNGEALVRNGRLALK
jgi:Thermophilic metalloprotease (M29)